MPRLTRTQQIETARLFRVYSAKRKLTRGRGDNRNPRVAPVVTDTPKKVIA